MPRPFALPALLLFTASVFAAPAHAANGYWRFQASHLWPTREALAEIHASPGGVLEQRVDGGFQAVTGQGSLQVFRKIDDADHRVYVSQLTYTFAAEHGIGDLVPGTRVRFQGDVQMTSNFPGAYASGAIAAGNADAAFNAEARPRSPAHGDGTVDIPRGSPGETLQLHASAYLSGYGALRSGLDLDYVWVAGAPPVTTSDTHDTTAGGSGFSGHWSTSEGDMDLAGGAHVTGTYSRDGGRIEGAASGGRLVGYWGENGSAQACASERMGTRFWGRIDWVLSPGGDRFEGRWSYCDAEPGAPWTGQRQGGGSPAQGDQGGRDSGRPSWSPQDSSAQGGGQEDGDHGDRRQGDRDRGSRDDGAGPPDQGGEHWGAAPAESRKLYDNWNTAGCGLTDEVVLDLPRPVTLERLEIWYNWPAGQDRVGYAVLRDGRRIGGGELRRQDCDPYQGAWCVAGDQPGADIGPGRYVIKVDGGRVCQNGGSAGRGFVRAWGRER